MKGLSIDLETYNVESVVDVGAHRYAENCEILLFGFAYDDDPVETIDLASGEIIDKQILRDVLDDNIKKFAFNAQFERTVLSKYLKRDWLSAKSWYCSMVMSSTAGLPAKLQSVSDLFWPGQKDKGKISTGKALIRYFSMPCKPTKVNGGRTRNMPKDAPDKWKLFKEYNIRDVEAERDIRKALEKLQFFIPEHDNYVVDQAINDRGVKIEERLVDKAKSLNDAYYDNTFRKLCQLTGLSNPMSANQFLSYLHAKGVNVDNVQKQTLIALPENTPAPLKNIVRMRLSLSKSTTKKYYAASQHLCSDGRIRGLFQFYGASRTGRFAGRGVQVQNLARNDISALLPKADLSTFEKEKQAMADVRTIVMEDNLDTIQFLFGDIPYTLSQLIRTMFIPSEGNEFIVSDYHAIEAVVSAWLCGEEWVLKEFRGEGLLYEATAAQMFKVDKYSITTKEGNKGPNYALRKKGKVASLAFGYGGAEGAALKMGADKAGMTMEEIEKSVILWRNANPHIVAFWRRFEKAVKTTITTHKPCSLYKCVTYYDHGFLRIKLPSGRSLSYARPHIEYDDWRSSIKYYGVNQKTSHWGELTTWGGKLLENIIQATARDILCNALLNFYKRKIEVVMHVHDEVIIDAPKGQFTVENINAIMCDMPDWCKDLPLSAAGFKTEFYIKD